MEGKYCISEDWFAKDIKVDIQLSWPTGEVNAKRPKKDEQQLVYKPTSWKRWCDGDFL